MPRTQGCGTHLRRRDAQQLHEVHKLLASNHSIPVLVGDGEDLLELEDAILRQVQAVLPLEVELLLEHRVLHQRLGGPSLGHLHLRHAGPRGGGRRWLSTGLSCSCCVCGGWGSGLLVTWILARINRVTIKHSDQFARFVNRSMAKTLLSVSRTVGRRLTAGAPQRSAGLARAAWPPSWLLMEAPERNGFERSGRGYRGGQGAQRSRVMSRTRHCSAHLLQG